MTSSSNELRSLDDASAEESARQPPELTHVKTTAATRRWSDVDHQKLLLTVAATTAGCCILSQPLYLVLARQQCAREHLGMALVAKQVLRDHGLVGFFRGCGATVAGMVIFQILYYFVVEIGKEHAPFESKAARDFAAGVAADGLTNPIYIPFSVIAQRQMTAGSTGVAAHEPFLGIWQTAKRIVNTSGRSSLFRGLGVSMALLPLAGLWWAVYESLKASAYSAIQASSWCTEKEAAFRMSRQSTAAHPKKWRMPEWCVSTTDNALVNVSVGAAASCVITIAANPLYVVRSRLQVMHVPKDVRSATMWVAKDIWLHEGLRGYMRGLRTNILVSILEGAFFAGTYEGSKLFADLTAEV